MPFMRSSILTQPQQRMFRRITRRFGSFSTKTYSNHTLCDVNVLITYGELSDRVLKVRGPFVQTLCIEKDPYMDAI